MRSIIAWSVFTCILYTIADALLKILFGFSIILFWGDLRLANGMDSGHWFWGTTLYLAVLLTVLGKAALISEYSFFFFAFASRISADSYVRFSLWTKYTVAGNCFSKLKPIRN